MHFSLKKILQIQKKHIPLQPQMRNGRLDERLSQRSAKPSTPVRIGYRPHSKIKCIEYSVHLFFYIKNTTNLTFKISTTKNHIHQKNPIIYTISKSYSFKYTIKFSLITTLYTIIKDISPHKPQ